MKYAENFFEGNLATEPAVLSTMSKTMYRAENRPIIASARDEATLEKSYQKKRSGNVRFGLMLSVNDYPDYCGNYNNENNQRLKRAFCGLEFNMPKTHFHPPRALLQFFWPWKSKQ